MKINYFLVLLAVFSLVVFGCTQNVAKDSTMKKEGAMANEKNLMMEKESGETAEIGFEMKNGKMMMVDEKTKAMTSMEKEAMLNDGTKVMTDGKVTKKDSTSFMLKEGESIWMDGTFMKAGEMMENKSMMEKDAMKKEEAMMEKSPYTGKILAGAATKYIDFNKADYDKALKENKNVILNFYANWCPICKAEQPEAFAAFNELNDANLVGFRVNYKDSDTDADEQALAKEFQVPYQHTKVIIKNGKQVLKAPDSWNKQRYLDELAKV